MPGARLLATAWAAVCPRTRPDATQPQEPPFWVEWGGALTGLLGAALLAIKSDYSGYGFVLFLGSNVCWLYFGLRTRAWGLVTMQFGFTGTSLLGMYNWIG